MIMSRDFDMWCYSISYLVKDSGVYVLHICCFWGLFGLQGPTQADYP